LGQNVRGAFILKLVVMKLIESIVLLLTVGLLKAGWWVVAASEASPEISVRDVTRAAAKCHGDGPAEAEESEPAPVKPPPDERLIVRRERIAGLQELGRERLFVVNAPFSFDEQSNEFQGWTVLRNGELVRVGGGIPEDKPTRETDLTLRAPRDGKPWVLVRGLGIRNDRMIEDQGWIRIDEKYFSARGYPEISKAFGVKTEPTGAEWFFDTRHLPLLLREEIPGGGIHIHVGQFLIPEEYVKIWDEPGRELEIRLLATVPEYEASGDTGGHLAVALNFVDMTSEREGRGRSISLLVGAFRGRKLYEPRDSTGWDGRNVYAAAPFFPGSKFITSTGDSIRYQPWSEEDGPAEFVARLTRENMKSIIESFVGRLDKMGLKSDYSFNPDDYAFSGFNARTEIGPTDGDKFVRIRVKVHEFDVYRVKCKILSD